MNQKSGLIILLGVILQCKSFVESAGASQIVAKFDRFSWDGKCTKESLREIPNQCSRQLDDNSAPEYKLACSIISNDGTVGRIPFGAYPPELMLDAELAHLSSQTLSQIFDECALAQMIQDGCFTFDIDTKNGGFYAESYLNADEYSSQMEEKHGLDVGGGFDIGVVDVNARYATSSRKFNYKSDTHAHARVSKEWMHSIGVLSMASCKADLMKYFKKSYITTIRNAYKFAKDYNQWHPSSEDVFASSDFNEFMKNGLLIPTAFQFAIRYAGTVNARYSSTSTKDESSMSKTIEAGFDAGFGIVSGGVSTSMEMSMHKVATDEKMNFYMMSYDSQYGRCGFTEALANNASNWSTILQECAIKTSEDLLLLDRAAYIPRGGFTSIFEILESPTSKSYLNSGYDGVTKEFAPLVKEYHSYCSCNPDSIYFQCFYGDGSFKKFGMFENHQCDVAYFEEALMPFRESKAILGKYVLHTDSLDFRIIEQGDHIMGFDGSRLYMKCGNQKNIILEQFHSEFQFSDASSQFTLCSDYPAPGTCKTLGSAAPQNGPYAVRFADDKGKVVVVQVKTNKVAYEVFKGCP